MLNSFGALNQYEIPTPEYTATIVATMPEMDAQIIGAGYIPVYAATVVATLPSFDLSATGDFVPVAQLYPFFPQLDGELTEYPTLDGKIGSQTYYL